MKKILLLTVALAAMVLPGCKPVEDMFFQEAFVLNYEEIAGPSKIKKIEDWRSKGHDIRIIYEEELKQILK